MIAGGCISAPGVGRCFYVLLPYAAQIGVTGSIVWAMTRWQVREYPMRAYVYQSTVKALPGRCLAGAILAGVGLIAETVYLLLSGSGGRGAAHNILWRMLRLPRNMGRKGMKCLEKQPFS